MADNTRLDAQEIPFCNDKGYKRVIDDDGDFVCHAMEFNGHIYGPFEDNFIGRLESYHENFPVYDDDIYVLAYPKSGMNLHCTLW